VFFSILYLNGRTHSVNIPKLFYLVFFGIISHSFEMCREELQCFIMMIRQLVQLKNERFIQRDYYH